MLEALFLFFILILKKDKVNALKQEVKDQRLTKSLNHQFF